MTRPQQTTRRNTRKTLWTLGVTTLIICSANPQMSPIDGVTAATTTKPVANPVFSAKVLSGPQVYSGARLLEGETLKLIITVTNPWKNNTVTMDFSPSLDGATLEAYKSSATSPSWLFTWKPSNIATTSTQRVTFNAYFLSGTRQVFPATTSIPVGPHAGPVFNAVAPQTAQVGQPLKLDISATSPEQNAIDITAGPLPTGSTLGKTAQVGTTGVWTSTLSWTPTTADVGTQTITFTATDDSGTATSNTLLPVTFTVSNLQTPSDPAIQSVTITKASWSASSQTLSTRGKIVLAAKAKLPAGSTVQLTAGNDIPLATSGSILKPAASGTWTATLKKLPAAQVPCQLGAQVLINSAASNLPGLLAVTGAPSNCLK